MRWDGSNTDFYGLKQLHRRVTDTRFLRYVFHCLAQTVTCPALAVKVDVALENGLVEVY